MAPPLGPSLAAADRDVKELPLLVREERKGMTSGAHTSLSRDGEVATAVSKGSQKMKDYNSTLQNR